MPYKCKQSDDENAPKLPTRAILCGASGEGKTHLLSELITQTYKGCFEAIYLWSPSAYIDPAYEDIRNYVEKKIQPDYQWMWDYYEAEDLQEVIDQQTGIIRMMKEDNRKKMYSICLVIDDFSDTPAFTRSSKQLWSLFARGRHIFASTFLLSQRWRSLAPICRLNLSVAYLHRMRNTKDPDAVAEELGGDRGKDEFLQAYKTAITDRPYSFLKVDVMAPRENQWQIRFTGRFL